MRGIKVELADPDIESRKKINSGNKSVPLCNEAGFVSIPLIMTGKVHCTGNS